MDNHDYDPKRILSEVFPDMPAKHGTFFPGYKYLNGVGITSIAELKNSEFESALPFFNKYSSNSFRSSSFTRPFIQHAKGMSAGEIVENFPEDRAAAYLPFLDC